MTAPTFTAPATPRSTYMALIEREIALDAIRANVARLESEHRKAMTEPFASMQPTLNAWLDAMTIYHNEVNALRADRNDYVLALISENEQLRGGVKS